MSCLDVMFHQGFGAHCLPTSSAAAAAAAYKAAYYHRHHQHHQQLQQKKLGAYSRMQQDSVEQQCPGARQLCGGGGRPSGEQDVQLALESSGLGGSGKDSQPAEAEYLSSRCVLFTYFHGNIGDVVDEHFSRALSQLSSFTGEAKATRSTPIHISGSPGLWKGRKDSVPLPEGQCGSLSSPLWGGSYPSQSSSCLSVHPDFSPSSAAFHIPDAPLWNGHTLPQPSQAPLPDAWAYSLGPQTSGSYPHVHDVYPHTHPHMHHRHPHPVLHPHPSHGPGVDPRFSPLLLPGVKTSGPHSPRLTTHSSRQSSQSPGIHIDVKTEVEQASSHASTLTPLVWPTAHHTSLDSYESGPDQEKVKAVWF
ncbi:hypothetical protein DPEC_G00048840 [Dallia pectoralis]|uniref:Uncharacterized protein n=1 Tax=Dallia pectoralis TaxID=75939 RepID=A0ACC2HAN0_DALPE|nr:hypothetical protein DPEC_G00048840 [Dallia pectoralis]